MTNFLIANESEAKDFNYKVDSYWIDRSTRYESSQELYSYYLVESNHQFIDIDKNNSRSLAIALNMGHVEFLDFLLNSDKLKNKNYLLKNISEALTRNSYTEFECVKLIIDAFKNKKDIFSDYSPKIKKLFIKSCISYLITSGFCEKSETKEYFFNYLKENKIDVYKNQYDIVEKLMNSCRVETLNTLVDNAKKIEDKKRILYLDMKYMVILEDTQDFLDFKRKEIETIEKYKELTKELNDGSPSDKGKKHKI